MSEHDRRTDETGSRQHTQLPPWSHPGSPSGVSVTSRRVCGDLVDRAATYARVCGTTVDRLWVAAWLATWSRCTGEDQVVTAVIDAQGGLREVELPQHPEVWMDVLTSMRTSDLLDPSVARAVLALTVTAGADHSGFIALEEAPLRVNVHNTEDAVILEATHRTEVVDGASAQRFLGYLVSMLDILVRDGLSAPADLSQVLTQEEIHEHLVGRAGPQVSNGPDLAMDHFLHRAQHHPDAPAVRHYDESLTYAELEARSRSIALALLAEGLQRGDSVGVVSARHLDWVTMLIGVMRAGGVYLPVRPDFPAHRVAEQFRRSGCAVALADEEGAALVGAVGSAEGWSGTVLTPARIHERAGLDSVELPAPGPEDLAYVYFTSGSTGLPKGAACEHAGLVNHLWTKIDDHGLTAGDVVSQTASQCFDISLWQVLAPLVVGGSVTIVDTADQLDAEAFLGLLERHGVTVSQIVPSYLEVLLAQLEEGTAVPTSLRSLSVTGEALKTELVRRWFALVDRVELVNAYGATEVSDDTMHHVLRAVPPRALPIVNVGRSLRNVRVYIVDDKLRLVPMGARGEIVFAGVCVGRGYLNDEQRTREAFLDDPYTPGERLYRSGDYGRWLPEGGIEFLGRRDEQVKIRGLRIEIGEVQSVVAGVPGITSAAVVAVGQGAGARLAAFYSAEDHVEPGDLHELLAASLPEYMIPSFFHRLEALPLNDNGKVDKPELKQLALAVQAQGVPFEPPATPLEVRLASAWAEVLGIPLQQIGRHDDFFQLGGTSLAAVHLVMRLDKQLSLRDLTETSVLEEQAALLEAGAKAGAGSQRLLQRLGRRPEGSGPVAICIPGAAGNALNFRAAADEACAAGVDLLALEPRGHDIARMDEPLLSLQRTVDLLVGDVVRLGIDDLHLWGQGAGAATALSLARELAAAGTPPKRVYLSGAVLGSPDEHLARAEAVQQMGTDAIIEFLQRHHGYVEVSGMDAPRRELVAAAYRHDISESEQFLARVALQPEQHQVPCPITAVLSAGDPYTTDLGQGRNWTALTDDLELDLLSDGGAETLRSRPSLLAELLSSGRAASAEGCA